MIFGATRRRIRSHLCAVLGWTGVVGLLLLSSARAQTSGLDAPSPIGGYLDGRMPTTSPGQPTGWEVENAFPDLTFVDPLWLAEIPGTSQFLVVGKNGRLWRFEDDPGVTQGEVVEVLDWRDFTETSGDQGFYSAVFHPDFGQAGAEGENRVFVCYNHRPVLGDDRDNDTYWRVSRFEWDFSSGTLDPDSEFILMNQYDPQSWHNGGAMFFGDDGFLYITCGDGGGSGDQYGNSQRLDQGLFSGVFRIDVDNDPAKSHPIRRQPTEDPEWGKPSGPEWPDSFSQGYGIPDSNPWLDPEGGVLEEFYAIGLRSPHTAHLDRVTGEIWIGDVGQGSREEMTRVVKGSNAQWSYREGNIDGPAAPPAEPVGVEVPPVHDYPRSVGSCIIGGMRYRGEKWEDELGGKVLFGDHVRGRIWTLEPDAPGGPIVTEIYSGFDTGSKAGLGNFCTDSEGEIYLMNLAGTDQGGGTIMRLRTQGVSTEPPQLLSELGVFNDLETLEPAPGVIPYEVANPLWSDDAAKRRWVILPNDGSFDTAGERIDFDATGNWEFPPGTVFVKHFEIADDALDPDSVKRLETRFIICTEGGGKYGVTYKWNDAETDAELLTTGLSEEFAVTTEGGGSETRMWDYPSRADCLICHSETSGQALGFRTSQLNRPAFYPSTGRTANQLATLNALGAFDVTLGPGELANLIESRALDDDTAPLEHRVRSYLDSNCAHCHQPGAQVDGFDARLSTPLNGQGLVGAEIQGFFDLGPDGRYIKAGDPLLSAVHVRAAAVNDGAAMPPLAKNRVDDEAVTALEDYILGLDPAEFERTPAPEARYLRLTALSEVADQPFTAVSEFTVLDGGGSPIPVSDLSVFSVSSEEVGNEFAPASQAIDGLADTYWHTEWGEFEPPHPHTLVIDLGSLREVGGYVYLPRQGSRNGRIEDYEIHLSADGSDWVPFDSGTWQDGVEAKRFEGGVGVRAARCQIAGPSGTVGGAFEATVVFDMDVTGFESSDLEVAGGSVIDLRGSGYYYVATILPDSPEVSVSVPADAVDPAGEGSLASAGEVRVDFVDTVVPEPVFVDPPSMVTGPFQLTLGFGEEVTGLEADDIEVVGGGLDAIIPDGLFYQLAVTPSGQGAVAVRVRDGAVADTAGNVMGEGTEWNLVFSNAVLSLEAESGVISDGFEVVSDAAASGGAYLWTPEGSRNGWDFDAGLKTSFTFVVPRTGEYYVRGRIRSDDFSSDSFYVGFDGDPAPDPWHTNQDGNVGDGLFHPDTANAGRDPLNEPSVYDLAAGERTLELYARDDGTRIDTIRLVSLRPLVTLAGPAVVHGGAFDVAVEFSEPVTGFESSDVLVSGATSAGLSGSGTLYTLALEPTSGNVTVSVPADVASDDDGDPNFASDPLNVINRTLYQEWAVAAGIDDGPAARMEDGDGDGIVNLLEWAFGMDPTRPDLMHDDPGRTPPAGLPRMAMSEADGETRLELTYLRRRGVEGLTYVPEFGDGPGAFEATSAAPEVEPVDDDWERVRVRDETGSPAAGRRFGRVRVIWEAP